MNNQRQVVSVSKQQIYPVNQLQEYSHKKGNPSLQFIIQLLPNQILDTKSIRLNYYLRIVDSTGTKRPQNADGANVPLSGQTAKEVLIDERTGTKSVISSLSIVDQQNNILEQIRDYGRLLSTLFPSTLSYEDYSGFTQGKYGAYGCKKVAQERACNADICQSQKLFCGIFSGKPIPGSMIKGGTLRVKINLSPDSFFLYGANAGEGYMAKMLTPFITCNVVNTVAPIPVMKQGFKYKHYSSFSQVLNASDNQQTLNLGTSNTLSVFCNFLPVDWYNNFTYNSLRTTKIRNKVNNEFSKETEIKNSTMLKNSLKYPLDFDLNEEDFVKNNNYDVLRGLYYLNSVKPYFNVTHTLVCPATEKKGSFSDLKNPDSRTVYGLGEKLDGLNLNSGSNYQMSTWGQRIVGSNDGSSPNQVFIFALSENTIIPSATSGPMVIT